MKEKSLMVRLASFIAVVAIATAPLFSHAFYGSGTVIDPSGGALSGGVATLTNVATCERRQKATRGSVKVTVSGTIRADISVQPGDVSQSVEVQVAVPLLRTEDPNPQCTTDGDAITGKNIFAAGNYRSGGGMAGSGRTRLAGGELICKENR